MNLGLSRSVQNFKKDINKQMHGLKRTQNLRKFTAKVNAKRRTLEMRVTKEVQSEIKKANQYLQARKKELNDFQKRITSLAKKKMRKNGRRYS